MAFHVGEVECEGVPCGAFQRRIWVCGTFLCAFGSWFGCAEGEWGPMGRLLGPRGFLGRQGFRILRRRRRCRRAGEDFGLDGGFDCGLGGDEGERWD